MISGLPGLASSLKILGSQLRSLARFEEALDVLRESVSLHRQRVGTHLETWIRLSQALEELRNLLRDLHRDAEALDVGRDALEVHRQMAEVRPRPFKHLYAASLGALAGDLADLGHPEEGCLRAREAVDLLLQLYADDPASFRQSLGAAAEMLQHCARAAGRREDEEYAAAARLASSAPR